MIPDRKSIQDLAKRILAKEPRAIARGMTLADDGEGEPLIRELYPHGGRALAVGITGPLGSGKSTLVEKLTVHFRKAGKSVGIVAVDPTSAFSGGAILGDRIRMQSLATDPGVFIRSLGTRGAMGGLSRSTADAVDLLDAAGKEVILVETVGVGQDEIDVASLAQVVLVLLVPGLGDEIQAMKAGLIEIGDIFVVNKADRPGADLTARQLQAVMSLAVDRTEEPPSILKTCAESGEGVPELAAAIAGFLDLSGDARRPERMRSRVGAILRERLLAKAEAQLRSHLFEATLDDLLMRETNPYDVAETLKEAMNAKNDPGSHRHRGSID